MALTDPKAQTEAGDKVFDQIMKEREDVFSEVKLLARLSPETMRHMHRNSGYVHFYTNQTMPHQQLSGQMRELIALCHLCAKGDDRFAANHVRRLWRFGVTDALMCEAGRGIAPIVGWSTILHIAQAILMANDPAYPFGEVPAGGAPTEVTPFEEMSMGREKLYDVPDSLADTPEWRYVAGIDPELASRATAWVDHCLLANGAGPQDILGPGARELIALSACCWRGEVELAAQHIRRAYAYGINRFRVLEAISCIFPMTGALTVQIGARAMQLAESGGPTPKP